MSWNKGLTKETNSSVRKISQTMRKKRIDNFSNWREKMKRLGKIKSHYPRFPKNEELAELIGVTLGDGHIGQFPRTEVLVIVSNSNNHGFVNRYARLIEKLFQKRPTIQKDKGKNSIRIRIYEKLISSRLAIPAGGRKNAKVGIPTWAWRKNSTLISCLRGLYEAEGSFSIHLPTSTYKAAFSNTNPWLLRDVYKALQALNFSPLYEKNRIMISRKAEFFRLKELLKFRQY